MHTCSSGVAVRAAAAGCWPADVLANQGSSLRSTDFVQMGMEEQRKKNEEQARVDRVAKSAQAHVDLFEYPQAVSDWKDAYRMSSDPKYLMRVAESQRAMGECGEAQLMYQQYLDN